MRYLCGFMCVLVLGVIGCGQGLGPIGGAGGGGVGGDGGEGGAGGDVIETIEEMLVGRWWLDWDKGGIDDTVNGIGLTTFTADGWANYDVRFPNIAGVTDWCRRYATWSLFDVVSETEFGYAQTYTHETCVREVGWT